MAIVVASFGGFVIVLGVLGIARPAWLLDVVTRVQNQIGLYAIAALRLIVGAACWLAAEASRAPLYLQVLGVVAILSGLITPFFGVDRFRAILDWWRGLPGPVVRAWSAVVVAFGASLVWAVR